MDIKKRSADLTNDEPIAKRLKKSSRMLESFINNPGLQHIAEKILQILCKHSLLKYRLVNSSWKRILDRPIFWFNKLVMKEFLENSAWKLMFQKNRWWNEPIFWFNKLVTKECFGEENVAKFKLEIFQNIQNLESDFDRKGFALGIIRQSMKADNLREEQSRRCKNIIRKLKSQRKKAKKSLICKYCNEEFFWSGALDEHIEFRHDAPFSLRQKEEKIRENDEKIRKMKKK